MFCRGAWWGKCVLRARSSRLSSSPPRPPPPPPSGSAASRWSPLALVERFPFTSQLMFVTFKTSVSDLIVQVQMEGKRWDEIDWRRNAVFVGFGFAYLGGLQYWIYVHVFARLFPAMRRFSTLPVREKLRDRAGMRALGGQIAADFLVVQPLFYWPTFYLFKQYIQQTGATPSPPPPPLAQRDGGGAATGKAPSSAARLQEQEASIFAPAMQRYKETFWVDNFGMTAFWLPVDIVMFSGPVWLRLPINHAASLLWTCVVSFFRGSDTDTDIDTDTDASADAAEPSPPQSPAACNL